MHLTRNRAKRTSEQPFEPDLDFERTVRRRAREQKLHQKRVEEEETRRMADQGPTPPVPPQGPGNNNGGNNNNNNHNNNNRAEQPEIRMRDRAIPDMNDFRFSIVEPQVNVEDFELKPSLIQMVKQSQFGGSPLENPTNHIQEFLQLCNTVKMHGVPMDVIRMQLFPFSLRDKAAHWLLSMPPDHFTSWEELSRAFIIKYFPPAKIAKIRNELSTFTQREGESLYEAWERNKDLQRQCPHHSIPEWLLIENFYNGLDQSLRGSLDAAAGGSLMSKSEAQARALIEEMALHNHQYGNPRGRTRGMYEMEAIQMLTAKLDQISHKMENLNVNPISAGQVSCGACGMSGHQSHECLQVNQGGPIEDVNAFNSRPAGNFYQPQFNSNWRNPNKLPMSNTSYPTQPTYNQNRPQNFSNNFANTSFQSPVQAPLPLPQPQKSRTESLLEQFIESQYKKEEESNQKFQQLFTKFEQLNAHNRMLESQITQLSAGPSQRDKGKLPSQPEANPKEDVHAITLWSGRELEKKLSESKREVVGKIKMSISEDLCYVVDEFNRKTELEATKRESSDPSDARLIQKKRERDGINFTHNNQMTDTQPTIKKQKQREDWMPEQKNIKVGKTEKQFSNFQ